MTWLSAVVDSLEDWEKLDTLAAVIFEGLQGIFRAAALQEITAGTTNDRLDEAEGYAVDLASTLFSFKFRKHRGNGTYLYRDIANSFCDSILEFMGPLTLFTEAACRRAKPGYLPSIGPNFGYVVQRLHERQDLRGSANAVKFRRAVALLDPDVLMMFGWSDEVRKWVQVALRIELDEEQAARTEIPVLEEGSSGASQ